jgi:threonylcarbamoyladenosine tRNA methylthiotransferase MtaB
VAAEFFVHNLGCKLNRAEADLFHTTLLAAGGEAVERAEARVIVVNTCIVTGEAAAKTRKAIRQALACPLAPWVIATGCALAADRDAWQALGERVIAVPDRTRAQEIALSLLELGEADASRAGDEGAAARGDDEGTAARADDDGAPRRPRTRTRRGIKIQDGCDNACSYCVVRLARGASCSVPGDAVRKQVMTAEREGVFEVVLTGVNIGSYDDDGRALCQLLEELLRATDSLRIRLSSLEPQHADDNLLALMAASKGRLCAHLHLPLQSGCDRTLEAMGRLYDTAFFARCVARARSLMPSLALTTDLIVGFPDERDEDFAESLAFCERMRFSRMHVFRYSRRPQTVAAARPDQIAPAVGATRARAARELAADMRARDGLARVGAREAVLIERQGRGTSESYHQVVVPRGIAAGQLVSLQIAGYRDNLLQARF